MVYNLDKVPKDLHISEYVWIKKHLSEICILRNNYIENLNIL